MSKTQPLGKEALPSQKRVGRPPRPANRTQLLSAPPVDRCSYIDSLWLTIPSKMPPGLLEDLKRSNGVYGLLRRKLRIKGLTKRPGYLVHIPQPCFRTLEILENLREAFLQAGGFSIFRVDVALDFLVEDRAAADNLHKYLVASLMPRKLRSESAPWVFKDDSLEEFCFPPPGWYDYDVPFGVASYLGYFTQRGARLAIYSTRTTKRDDTTPCTRLEWRTLGAEAVSAAGLDSTDSLRALDYRQFWDQRLRLFRNVDSISTSVQSSATSFKPVANFQSATTCQQLSHRWMLPDSENALWEATSSRLRSRGTRIIRAANQFNYRTPLLGDAYTHLY